VAVKCHYTPDVVLLNITSAWNEINVNRLEIAGRATRDSADTVTRTPMRALRANGREFFTYLTVVLLLLLYLYVRFLFLSWGNRQSPPRPYTADSRDVPSGAAHDTHIVSGYVRRNVSLSSF